MANSTQIIITSIVGFAVGWFSQMLAGRRELQKGMRERKIQFLRFVAQWRSEIEQSQPGPNLHGQYRVKLHLFRAESAAIDNDFAIDKWMEFLRLCLALGRLSEEEEEYSRENMRVMMAHAIDAIMGFVEAT